MEDGDVSEWFDRTTFVVDRPGRYHGGYMLPPADDWDRVREVHMRWRYAGATIYSMLCPDPIPVLTMEHPDYLPATVFNEMRTVPATRVIHRSWRRRWDPEFVAREIEALEAAIEAREQERLHRHRIRTPSPPRPQPQVVPKFVADALVTAAVAADAICPITMDPIRPENAAVTSCFHVFEANAIAIWLTTNHTCPTCKQAAVLPV
jgi:hypothetical protein